jgi:hypothetical protein
MQAQFERQRIFGTRFFKLMRANLESQAFSMEMLPAFLRPISRQSREDCPWLIDVKERTILCCGDQVL